MAGAQAEVVPAELRAALLDQRYAPHFDWRTVLSPHQLAQFVPAAPYWRSQSELRAGFTDAQPLRGARIALDPGHWGGVWASASQRDFRIGDDHPVREGELVLEVARIARDRLHALGAEVELVRASDAPLVPAPGDEWALEPGELNQEWVRRDIRERCRRINEEIRPDLVVALHVNAAPWPERARMDQLRHGDLVDAQHFHVLLFGSVMRDELGQPGQSETVLEKVCNGSGPMEIVLGESMVAAFRERAPMPPFRYQGRNAVQLDREGYLWGRNLLANRLIRCPTLYLEPYVANGVHDYRRIQKALESRAANREADADDILVEYAETVCAGLVAAFAVDG